MKAACTGAQSQGHAESGTQSLESSPAGKIEIRWQNLPPISERLLNHQRTKDTKHGKSLWKPPTLVLLVTLWFEIPIQTNPDTGRDTNWDLGQGIEMCPHPTRVSSPKSGPLPEYRARVKERDSEAEAPSWSARWLQMLI